MPLAQDKITKSFIFILIVTSLLFSLTSTTYHLRLPLSYLLADPTYQCYRLISHQLGFTQSADLFLAVILISQMSGVERALGSHRFLKLLIQTLALYPVLFVTFLVGLQKIRWIHGDPVLGAGPWALVGAIAYQYYEVIPTTLNAQIFSLPFTNKSLNYLFMLQIFINHPLPTAFGILISLLFRHTRMHHLLLPLPVQLLVPSLSQSTTTSIPPIPADFGAASQNISLTSSTTSSTTEDGTTNLPDSSYDSVFDRIVIRVPVEGRIFGSLSRRATGTETTATPAPATTTT